jgi:hypothetical protein
MVSCVSIHMFRIAAEKTGQLLYGSENKSLWAELFSSDLT